MMLAPWQTKGPTLWIFHAASTSRYSAWPSVSDHSVLDSRHMGDCIALDLPWAARIASRATASLSPVGYTTRGMRWISRPTGWIGTATEGG